jgi:3-isopropylmalate/(R)-2-methylmalate dehydratase small subunit
MKTFGGPVLFLDRSDINTDEIIPAKYLTEVTKEALRPHLLEDLKIPGFDPKNNSVKKSRVVVSRGNFGCGSSREHAPWVFEVNAINVVVAESFARIFRQNMFNCGMLAIELSKPDIDGLFSACDRATTICDVDFSQKTLIFSWAKGESRSVAFSLAQFDEALVQAGGWVEFADTKY